MNKYILIIGLLAVVAVMYFMKGRKPETEEDMYRAFLQEIKKAFNNILIDITYIPEIGDKTLVKLNNIDDLVDISEQIRKPIYYIENEKTCDFILLNGNEYCLYTLKISEDLFSEFDRYYIEYEKKNKKENTKILEDLDKTTIIKIQDGSSFKVSPLRNRDLRKMKEKEFQESIKEDVLPKVKEEQ